jgi:hypothetical protein
VLPAFTAESRVMPCLAISALPHTVQRTPWLRARLRASLASFVAVISLGGAFTRSRAKFTASDTMVASSTAFLSATVGLWGSAMVSLGPGFPTRGPLR